MRPLEILLILIDFIAVIVIVVPRLRASRPIVGGIIVLVLIAVATQILVEGPRWQMIPAYTLAVFLVLAGLVRLPGSSDGIIRRALASRLVRGIAIAAASIGMVLGISLPLAMPVFQLP